MIAAGSEWIRAFAGMNVAVLGDAMLDVYLAGTTRRLCPEAPVPVVDVATRHDLPGGAANVAWNLACLGARPVLVSAVGEDAEGALLRQALVQRDVSTAELLARPLRRTLCKSRVLIGPQMIVRVDQGTTQAADAETERMLIESAVRAIAACDLVLISDYGYGVLTPGLIAALEEILRRTPRTLVVDSKNLPAFRRLDVLAVKPNYQEAMKLLGAVNGTPTTHRWRRLLHRGDEILQRCGARVAAVTLDAEGALIFQRGGEPYRTYAQRAPHFHVAGAGDTFLSALALALAVGTPTKLAAELAAAAAAVVVSKEYTATCSAEELLRHISGQRRPYADLADALAALDYHRRLGRRIVFTNGCFDILHHGHVTYLQQAKALGDVLVVGVNSDASIRRLKGPERPINALAERAGVLAALGCVDHVVAFDEDTPQRLIAAVRPDVFVKGGDYTRETLPEATLVERLGGRIEILPLVADRSTSRIIQRIRAADPPGNGHAARDDAPPAFARLGEDPCAAPLHHGRSRP